MARRSSERPRLIGGIRLPSGEVTAGRRSSRSLRRRNAIVAHSLDLAGRRVLDIGCADGLHALYMSATAAEVVGIDHRRSEIDAGRATAEALGIRNVQLICGDVRDAEVFARLGRFDLVVAWGFLHRISDVFSFLYGLEPLADAVSLEWRTPVAPMLSGLSIAYHPSGGRALDPLNTGRTADARHPARITDADKIEGDTAFWEPTPGCVSTILGRLGYRSRLLGYDEGLVSQRAVMRKWVRHVGKALIGRGSLAALPRARAHMLFEKRSGAIALAPAAEAERRFPEWDRALRQSLARR